MQADGTIGGFSMGMSKKDMSKQKAKLKARIAELEKKVKADPMKKNKAIHDEYEKCKKELGEE